ncbi:hypothetical protein [Paraburkholderia rhynchosiae]|nr:hypothetical protein [Paraburkholderia rhynchosiae]
MAAIRRQAAIGIHSSIARRHGNQRRRQHEILKDSLQLDFSGGADFA